MYIAEEAAASVFSYEEQDRNRRQVTIVGNGRLNVELRTPVIFKAPLLTYILSLLSSPASCLVIQSLAHSRPFPCSRTFSVPAVRFPLKLEALNSSEILSIHHTTSVTATKIVIVIICILFMLKTYRSYKLWLMTFSTRVVFSFIKEINPFTHSLIQVKYLGLYIKTYNTVPSKTHCGVAVNLSHYSSYSEMTWMKP